MAERKTQPLDNFTVIVTEKLRHIEDAIYGNGHEGINVRLARIEENVEASTVLVRDNAAQVTRLIEAAAKLDASVETHHAKDHLSDLMKKKGFWAIVVIAFIVLHFVSTYFPDMLNFLLTLVGLPHLPAP